MRNRLVIDNLLSRWDIHPILVDIGASAAPPAIWEPIARRSIYVGFDPDLREIREIPQSRFYKAIMVNEAVTTDKGNDEVTFYLTRSPFCSSTLWPDAESLSNFLFSDLFVVERESRVRAATLDSVAERLSLPRIDWFKTDSQGTDLRIFNSLRPEVRSRVLAVDIEPGLIDAYIGEDLFVDAHRELTQNGFWLSNLNVCGAVRMRNSTLCKIMAAHPNLSRDVAEKAIKPSPGWCEARYLRTPEWLAQGDFTKRDYLLLWIFALLENQVGFSLDVAMEYEKRFGEDDASQTMRNEPILLMRRAGRMARFAAAKSLPRRIVRRISRVFEDIFKKAEQ